jgi:hypothetical protein
MYAPIVVEASFQDLFDLQPSGDPASLLTSDRPPASAFTYPIALMILKNIRAASKTFHPRSADILLGRTLRGVWMPAKTDLSG